MSKLIDLAKEHRELAEKMADLDLPDEVIADTLEGERLPLEQKASAVLWVAANFEAMAAKLAEREKAIAARRKAMAARAERLQDLVMTGMKIAQVTLIETPDWKMRVKKSSPSVTIDAPTQVPPEYMRFPDPPPPEPDKAKIKEVLVAARRAQEIFDSGKPIDEAQTQAIEEAKKITFAHLEQSEYLDIR
jgi:hypothetical protein